MTSVAIHRAILFLDHLVLVGCADTKLNLKQIVVEWDRTCSAHLAPAVSRFVHRTRVDGLSPSSLSAPGDFISVSRIEDAALLEHLVGANIPTITMQFSDRTRHRQTVPVVLGRTALEQDLFNGVPESALAAAFKMAGSNGEILAHCLLKPKKEQQLALFADSLMRFPDETVLACGWGQDADLCAFFIADEQLARGSRVDSVVFSGRPDIQNYLSLHGRACRTDRLGFSFAHRNSPPGKKVLLLTINEHSWGISESQPYLLPNEVKPKLLQFLKSISINGLPSDDVLQPVIDVTETMPTIKPELREELSFFENEDANPDLSIVIPFYGEDFFLLDQIEAQARAPRSVEWVFVCDDPRIAERMKETLYKKRAFLRQPTKLLILRENVGFGGANNIGAAHARGTFLLLMNSDVYCENFRPILYGLRLMENSQHIGCTGFSLLYEDQTIQHNGMQFETNTAFRDCWVCAHPGKGLPASWDVIEHSYVQTVTGAMMMLRREEWLNEDIFDDRFVVGGYEDADLCMRIREAGYEIALVTGPGLYHLESQSFRTLQEERSRHALAYLNCRRLNKKWDGEIRKLAARESC